MKAKILVVEDEPDVVEMIAFNLSGSGFDVISAANGEDALVKACSARPDLILLDLMLPEVDGLEVCKILRRNPSTAAIPIIIVTAKAAEVDRVVGLELGADDYVTKPFSPRELVLRIKNLLRRRQHELDQADVYRVGQMVIDMPRHQVTVNSEPIELTATEFRLLTVLAQRRGRVQSRDQLLRDVWEYNSLIDTRTVDTHVRRLRNKLGAAAKHIGTVRGVGYRLVEE